MYFLDTKLGVLLCVTNIDPVYSVELYMTKGLYKQQTTVHPALYVFNN